MNQLKNTYFGKENPKEELKFVMACLTIVCAACLLFYVARTATLCFRLGQDDTDGLIWQLIPESLMLVAMLVCSSLVFLMLHNVRKGEVFSKLNANLIMSIGIVCELNAILQMALANLLPGGNQGDTTGMVLLLAGVFFLFISCLFKLGIRMQEEQDLTI